MTRLYLQCRPDEPLEPWTDARIWEELQRRLTVPGGPRLNEGPILQKSLTPMRSFVVEPMQYGRLFLAGDAAHIVPPTGAKGMNQAAADVQILSRAFAEFYGSGSPAALRDYSAVCLERVWKVQRFSRMMTDLMHVNPDDSPFDTRCREAELAYLATSANGAATFAENYVGLPVVEPDLNGRRLSAARLDARHALSVQCTPLEVGCAVSAPSCSSGVLL